MTWTATASPGMSRITTISNLVIGTDGFDIYASLDSGATFPINVPGPIDVDITSIDASDTDLYIGTDYSGVWWMPLLGVTSVEDLTNNNPDISINIYPNPVISDHFTLEVETYTRSMGIIEIFEATGKLVLTKQLTLDGLGAQQIILPTADLSPGLYIVSITTESTRRTKQVSVFRNK